MAFDERMMNGISVLCAIVDSGSFAAASELLDMTPSGVSRAVARLEARLGIRLFDRTTRSITLTDEGRRFHAQVAPLLAALEEAASSAQEGRSMVRGRLRVNVDPFFSRMVLGPRLGAFLTAHPELNLELITRDELGDMIADGYDLALRFGQPHQSTLVARKLMDCRIVTIASPGYLKRHGRPATPQQLQAPGHTCILFRDSRTGRPFTWEFIRGRKRIEMEMQGQLTVNDGGSLYSVCLSGYGVAQVFDLGLQPMLEDGRLVDLFPDWPDERFPLYALYPSRHHPPAKVRAFLDFVLALQK
ncbi:MAG: HTH-type transcriptional regulator DmlR [Herbaspirillum frisingense]|uniref:HTH-type transcriptional regulator DmlR n=1 Tax=Herbaspirillum frisingense TaxID=92645 RepID=A0A7V8JUV2_9BURK|nr:MAG: HTH-type transcriptional regulator DmlR [Herbaspirillum frisingense]